jgi:hypothetical protein
LSSEQEKWGVEARDQLSDLFISVNILGEKNPSETLKPVLKSVRLEGIRAQKKLQILHWQAAILKLVYR